MITNQNKEQRLKMARYFVGLFRGDPDVLENMVLVDEFVFIISEEPTLTTISFGHSILMTFLTNSI